MFCGDPVTKLHAEVNRYFTDRDMPSGRGYPLSLEGDSDDRVFSQSRPGPPGSLAGERPQTRVQDWFGAWTNEDNEPPETGMHLEHGMAFRLQSVAWCFVEAWGRETPVPLIETLLVGKETIQAHGPAQTRRLVEVSPSLFSSQRKRR